MSSYGGYYTRQEQEDAMTARIDNPNRVGSGFINLGPMQRQPQAASTNWQTSSLLGGGGGGTAAPPGVSDIWNNTPQPPPAPRLPQHPVPPVGAPPGMAGRYGAADQASLGLGFAGLNLDSAAPSAAMHGQPYHAGLGVGHFGMSLGDVHGRVVPPPPSAPAPSLMNLLHTPAPTAPSAGLSPGFSMGMGNGGQPTSQPFANPPMPQGPPVQLQANGMHSSPFAPGSFAPPVTQPPPRPPAGPPRVLSSAADYAAAAQVYKPPVPARNASVAAVSVSRQPEASKAQPTQPMKEEWECPRCTFLNNMALRECEMCAFERMGRDEAPASRSEEDGWHTASSAVRRPAPVPTNPALPGKSKAQSKNEKRRAKKRGDQ